MSGFPSRAAAAAEPIPIGSCVPLTRTTNNPAFLPVGSLIERARYPDLSARYPRIAGVSVVGASIATRDFRNAAFDGKRIIAVAINSDAAIYSDDLGKTWADSVLPSATNWAGIAYGDGKWVAVRQASADCAHSPDGVTWTPGSLPASRGWYTVAFGGGRFVVTAPGSDKSAYSTDGGVTWTEATLPSSGDWYGLSYGGGRFVATRGTGSNAAAYSTDGGATWTGATLPSSGNWYTVSYCAGLFVAMRQSSALCATSPDGATWTERAMPSSQFWRVPVLGSAPAFLAYSYDSPHLAYSADGVNWSPVVPTSLGTYARQAAVYAAGVHVMLGSNGRADLAVPDGPGATHMLLGGPAGYHVRVR